MKKFERVTMDKLNIHDRFYYLSDKKQTVYVLLDRHYSNSNELLSVKIAEPMYRNVLFKQKNITKPADKMVVFLRNEDLNFLTIKPTPNVRHVIKI